jgi:hypothetical protein
MIFKKWFLNSLIFRDTYRFPKMLNEQTLNEEIKEIGKLVPSLNRSIKYTKGGVVVKETLKRYQLLVLHCARRTLATM